MVVAKVAPGAPGQGPSLGTVDLSLVDVMAPLKGRPCGWNGFC